MNYNLEENNENKIVNINHHFSIHNKDDVNNLKKKVRNYSIGIIGSLLYGLPLVYTIFFAFSDSPNSFINILGDGDSIIWSFFISTVQEIFTFCIISLYVGWKAHKERWNNIESDQKSNIYRKLCLLSLGILSFFIIFGLGIYLNFLKVKRLFFIKESWIIALCGFCAGPTSLAFVFIATLSLGDSGFPTLILWTSFVVTAILEKFIIKHKLSIMGWLAICFIVFVIAIMCILTVMGVHVENGQTVLGSSISGEKLAIGIVLSFLASFFFGLEACIANKIMSHSKRPVNIHPEDILVIKSTFGFTVLFFLLLPILSCGFGSSPDSSLVTYNGLQTHTGLEGWQFFRIFSGKVGNATLANGGVQPFQVAFIIVFPIIFGIARLFLFKSVQLNGGTISYGIMASELLVIPIYQLLFIFNPVLKQYFDYNAGNNHLDEPWYWVLAVFLIIGLVILIFNNELTDKLNKHRKKEFVKTHNN